VLPTERPGADGDSESDRIVPSLSPSETPVEFFRERPVSKRICLIHAVATAIPPMLHAFREGWPEAQLSHLLDDDLMPAYTRAGGLTPHIVERICELARYAARTGVVAQPAVSSARTPDKMGTNSRRRAITAFPFASAAPIAQPQPPMIDAPSMVNKVHRTTDRIIFPVSAG
jgi:hypothetical protein